MFLKIYTKPLRVYIILGALAIWGIVSGLKLPISLFPNSSEVVVSIRIPTGSLSSQQFYELYGADLEYSLQTLKINQASVKLLQGEYDAKSINYIVNFDWGAEHDKALNEITSLVRNRLSAAGNEEILRGLNIQTWSEKRGFFAVSFFSPMRSLDEVYQILDPLLNPVKSKIVDSSSITLWNPSSKEITITLLPEKMAQFELGPKQIQNAIENASADLNGGIFELGEKKYHISLPKSLTDIESLSHLRVSENNKSPIFLKDVARISYGISVNSKRKFKTSGVESLILFAEPKEGGNIKRMSDQIVEELNRIESLWPKDIKYKIIVNPSEFINNSIESVIHEVFLAAILAVIVLFLFIGNLKNVITAAIEIPLSLLMSFILMRISGMNLNLISLGGLALSAGMNVDASVVVLENIIRNFELHNKNNNHPHSQLNYHEKATLVIKAVNEVKIPIIASTIASLVVFMPLIFTQGLTYALLGDLAKAVIFSHGLSAFVALILVPTIRLQLISKGLNLESHSPIEKFLNKLEAFYKNTLSQFMESKILQKVIIGIILSLLITLIILVIPRLEKEVIGKPESDWLMIGINAPILKSTNEMESELEILEESINLNFKEDLLYTFTQVQGANNGLIMIRVSDKSRISTLIEKAENIFKNTSSKYYWVDYWNPSELSIPDPPHFKVEISGGDPIARRDLTLDLEELLLEKGSFDDVRTHGTNGREKGISITPLVSSNSENQVMTLADMSFFLRVINEGIYANQLKINQQSTPIYLRWPNEEKKSIEFLKAIPIGYEGKVIPLGDLANIDFKDKEPSIYHENQKSLYALTGRLNRSHLSEKSMRIKQAQEILASFKSSHPNIDAKVPMVTEIQPDLDLTQALDQLKWAVVLSTLLIFLTMVIQLGDIIHSLLVLVAIPLGFIGVLLALFIFKSTLSLNSGLGTILLNGIAVANSIILVDFIKKLFEEGMSAKTATLEAASARLRPILMTSLTTVLGMLPIALGMGEGGKILQPLGIAVCGGLWISTLLTLYIVPTLQYIYLSKFKERK